MAEYISRERLLEKLGDSEVAENDRIDIGYNAALQDVKQYLTEMPTADVQSIKHGRWIGVDYDTYFECSECKHMTDWQLYKYCPYCGARMDLKDGDTNE